MRAIGNGERRARLARSPSRLPATVGLHNAAGMTGFSAQWLLRQLTQDRTAHYGAAIGVRFHAEGADWAEFSLPYDPALAADARSGIMASGQIMALMDMASSAAVWIVRRRFAPQATLDLRIDHLRAAMPGRTIYGHGECYRIERRVAFVRGQAHEGDRGDPILHVAGTFMLMGDEA